ncbi:MAG: helix-turn-helix domain-containing protein [bacterium]
MLQMIASRLQQVIDKGSHQGKSDRVLATELGISHVALWKLRTGWKDKDSKPYNPSLEMLDRLCKFFKCKVGDILEYRKM